MLNKKQVCEAIAARREEAETGGGVVRARGRGGLGVGGVVLLTSISPLLEKKINKERTEDKSLK